MPKSIAMEMFLAVKQCVKDILIPKPSGLNEDLLADYQANREKPMLHWQNLNRRRDELIKQIENEDNPEAFQQLCKVQLELCDHHKVVDYMLAVDAKRRELGLVR